MQRGVKRMKTPIGADRAPVVAHFVRRRSQLDQSFIFNQASFHIRYRPVFVSSQANNIGVLAQKLLNAHPSVVASLKVEFATLQVSSAVLRWLEHRPEFARAASLKLWLEALEDRGAAV